MIQLKKDLLYELKESCVNQCDKEAKLTLWVTISYHFIRYITVSSQFVRLSTINVKRESTGERSLPETGGKTAINCRWKGGPL